MIISTKGRYALRVMVDLAEQNSNDFIPLKDIAARQEISEKYLESILKILVQNGLLEALRGKGGGYRLTRPPAEYSIGSILRLAEGDLASVRCVSTSFDGCSHKEKCQFLPMWQKLDSLINNYLDSVTLADLMNTQQQT